MSIETFPQIYARKRELHPELERALDWRSIRAVLAREQIRLIERPLPRPAQLAHFAGAWSIVLNSDAPAARSTFFVAHELSHLWLHHDHRCDRWERTYNMHFDCGPDPREDEADLLANLLLGGPDFLRRFWR